MDLNAQAAGPGEVDEQPIGNDLAQEEEEKQPLGQMRQQHEMRVDLLDLPADQEAIEEQPNADFAVEQQQEE